MEDNHRERANSSLTSHMPNEDIPPGLPNGQCFPPICADTSGVGAGIALTQGCGWIMCPLFSNVGLSRKSNICIGLLFVAKKGWNRKHKKNISSTFSPGHHNTCGYFGCL